MEESADPSSESKPVGGKVSAYLYAVVSLAGITSGIVGFLDLLSLTAPLEWVLDHYRRITSALFAWLPFEMSSASRDAAVLLAVSAAIAVYAARYFYRAKRGRR